jgi:hypothetical protein
VERLELCKSIAIALSINPQLKLFDSK